MAQSLKHPTYMFFPQNAGTECATQEEAHPVSTTTMDVGLPVVMTTSEVVTGLAAVLQICHDWFSKARDW